MSRHLVRGFGFFLAAFLVACLSTQEAYALGPIDNMTYTCKHGGALETDMSKSSPCMTDNRNIYFWMEKSIDTSTRSDTIIEASINATLLGDYNNTRLNVYYDPSPVFSGASETDIVYRSNPKDFNDPAHNYIGYMWCDSRTPALNRCDQAYINFLYANRDQYNSGQALACHETGHAVGLLHGSDAYKKNIKDNDSRLGCMVTPVDGGLKRLGSNNESNINDVY